MTRYVQLGLVSILAGTVLAAVPQQANNDWRNGVWNPLNWMHRTVGSPVSQGAATSSHAASAISHPATPTSTHTSSHASSASHTTSPTKRTSSTSHAAAPSHTAGTTQCTQYHHVQAGDSCMAVEAQYGITFDQLYEWNPSIGSNCQYLVIGNAYCVAMATSGETAAMKPPPPKTSSTIAPPKPTTTLVKTSKPTPTSTIIPTTPPAAPKPNPVAGKRGIAYNDASYATLFANFPQLTWGYDWWQAPNGLPAQYNFVPMLWGTADWFVPYWTANVATALNAGSTHLLGFNEPDLSSQSNLSPSDAASAWMQYMQPHANQAKLCSPAITNGNTPTMGFNWLSSFMQECSQCTIDVITLHWYNIPGTADDFKNHITTAHQLYGKPIWVTEFGLVNAGDDDINSFLQEVLPWLDAQDYVQRYAYFMAATNNLVDGKGDGLSDYGQTYATYTR